MSRENVEIVRRSNAAFNRRDRDEVFADYHPEVEWRDLQHAPDAPESVRGIAAVYAIWDQWDAPFGGFVAEVEEYVDVNEFVVAVTHWRAKGGASGVDVEVRTADLYTFTGGKIVRVTLGYPDKGAALQAVGMEEQAVSQKNVEIIQRGFVVWGETGEPDWSTMHDDVEAYDHDLMDAGEYRGRAGLERWLEDWASAWSEFSMEPVEFIDAGERVVVVILMRAKGRGSAVEVEREDAVVHEMRDGKVVRLDYYNNREQALRSVGLE